MDAREAELLAFEVAFLERNGWTLYNGQWRHPNLQAGVEHTRETAVGIQKIWTHEAKRRSITESRFPVTPPPAPEPSSTFIRPAPGRYFAENLPPDEEKDPRRR